VICGLGNPGREYERTRHNVGWWVVDHLADVWRFDGWRRDGRALVASGRAGGQSVRLLKPQTYMNLSGDALIPYARRPTWSPASDLLVVVDEVALPLGAVRLRASGSPGGHNGLKSVEHALGTRDYARLRIGIGPSEPRPVGDLADFVLHPFGAREREVILELLPKLADGIEIWLRAGIIAAMNTLNRRPAPPPSPSTE
jgi:PTH1 family peptidyl-tRNA hydrolase